MNMVYPGSSRAELEDTSKLQEQVVQSPMSPRIALAPLPQLLPMGRLPAKEEEKPVLGLWMTGYYVDEAENEWRLHYSHTQEWS